MGRKKARVVIVGAGMAGLVAADKLCNHPGAAEAFELAVVEGGCRIGGRICTGEFCGDRVEMGATWIHGVGGSPVHKIAAEAGALHSPSPWERMDGFPDDPITVAEGGGGVVNAAAVVRPISSLYRSLMDFAKGESGEPPAYLSENPPRSVGEFLRRRSAAYHFNEIEAAVLAMHENMERTYTAAGDLYELDLAAEAEYEMLPGKEITIARGYSRVVEEMASSLPQGLIRLWKKVTSIHWLNEEDDDGMAPVKLHFEDGTAMAADHVIVTVSLGVLKAGTKHGLFKPSLPSSKTGAIDRLGFGVVNKLFLELDELDGEDVAHFPNLQMVFRQSREAAKQGKVPWWMRRTASICPIYKTSKVLLSWFAGEEALELETLDEEEVKSGVMSTLASFAGESWPEKTRGVRLGKVLKTGWGRDPLFLGSYSFVAVGSSGDDLDLLAAPLPGGGGDGGATPPLQILFAGEATDRIHYSTTHGAYFSGLREANRLLKHYKLSCDN